jgi:hypothetical protein
MTDIQAPPGAPPAPPATPQEARTRLDTLIKDRDFGARLVAGDAAANREFSALQKQADSIDPTDKVAAAMAGIVSPGPFQDSDHVQMMHTAEMLREVGVREEVIAETLRGHTVSENEMRLVEAWRSRQMKDPAFVRSFLSGDPEARRLMTLSAIVVSGGVTGARGRF